jgi:hypothetical protein
MKIYTIYMVLPKKKKTNTFAHKKNKINPKQKVRNYTTFLTFAFII